MLLEREKFDLRSNENYTYFIFCNDCPNTCSKQDRKDNKEKDKKLKEKNKKESKVDKIKQILLIWNYLYIIKIERTYTSEHALTFSDCTTTSQEADDHDQTTNCHQDIGACIDKIQLLVGIGVLGEVVTNQEPDPDS